MDETEAERQAEEIRRAEVERRADEQQKAAAEAFERSLRPHESDIENNDVNTLDYGAAPHPDSKLVTTLQAYAKKMGLPPIQVRMSRLGSLKSSAFLSYEDNAFLVIPTELPFDEAVSAGIHELGHISLGHFKMSKKNSILEYDADMVAVQQCYGRPLLKTLHSMMEQDDLAIEILKQTPFEAIEELEPGLSKKLKEAGFPNISNEAIENVLDPDHPPYAERFTYLRKAIKHAEAFGMCPAPTPVLPKDDKTIPR